MAFFTALSEIFEAHHGGKSEVLSGQDSRQTISIWDVISEGPIEGLVDGNASVFLDNDPMVEVNSIEHTTRSPSFGTSIQLTSGSANATVSASSTLSSAVGRILFIDDAKAITGLTGTIGSNTITASGGIPSEVLDTPPSTSGAWGWNNFIKVIGAGPTGLDIYYNVYARPTATTALVPRSIIFPFSNASGALVYQVKVDSVSGSTTLVLTEPWPFSSGTYNLALGTASVLNPTSTAQYQSGAADLKKVPRSTLQFRTGNVDQEPIRQIGNLQGSSISRTSGLDRTLELHSDYYQYFADDNRSSGIYDHTESQGTDSTYIVDSVSDLGLTNSGEVDELVLTFEYSTLVQQHYENGNQYGGYSAFLVDFSYSRDSGATYTDVTLPIIEHKYKALQAFSIDENINLEAFQPFDRWKVKIKRITASSGAGYALGNVAGKPLSTYDSDGKRLESSRVLYRWRLRAPCSLASITSIIKQKLNYPYTAYAAITFDSKAYSSMPTRSYLIRGRKVKVPSNYETREESASGVASYNRDSSGNIQSSYQDWDGTFREGVYTNNPAWVLYDLIHSKRYGLGRFVDTVDKWSFFRVAKYCDELVPDGKGGEEPRYTCNLVLQKEAGARKVIKDLATNFIGLLHWVDGEMYLTADQPSAPVYNFGRGNVIDGNFSYSSSEYKKRPNQYVVVWNNPDLDYQQDFVLVEDTENILDRGLVLSKETVAFGCTSRSQAERYGRWRLFTDRLQTRSVSFATSINASFLNPGDIITIQDANLDNTELSGRIALTTGTVNATTVAIDRNIVLQSGYDYTLNVLFFSPAAILVDDSATINSVAYTKGDVILTTNNGSDLTETSVNNLTDEADSNRPVNVSWKPDTHVESRAVSTSPGTVDSLTVSTAFSTNPTRGSMWTLSSRNNNILQSSSSKEYLVTSVTQTQELVWEVSAAEHFNSKFASVEGKFNLTVDNEDFKGPASTDIIPTVSNLTLSFANE